jgi:hypothetical protein
MIRDDPSQRVFGISELARLVAGHLTHISPKSTANLACACRCLEEPALSTLLETQSSLCTLLEVLPEKTWGYGLPLLKREVCGLNLLLGESNAQVWDCVSLGLC